MNTCDVFLSMRLLFKLHIALITLKGPQCLMNHAFVTLKTIMKTELFMAFIAFKIFDFFMYTLDVLVHVSSLSKSCIAMPAMKWTFQWMASALMGT